MAVTGDKKHWGDAASRILKHCVGAATYSYNLTVL